MTRIQIALGWAAALILLALATRFGFIATDTGTVLVLVLPLVACISIASGACRPRGVEASR